MEKHWKKGSTFPKERYILHRWMWYGIKSPITYRFTEDRNQDFQFFLQMLGGTKLSAAKRGLLKKNWNFFWKWRVASFCDKTAVCSTFPLNFVYSHIKHYAVHIWHLNLLNLKYSYFIHIHHTYFNEYVIADWKCMITTL